MERGPILSRSNPSSEYLLYKQRIDISTTASQTLLPFHLKAIASKSNNADAQDANTKPQWIPDKDMDTMLFSVNDGRPRKWKKWDAALPRLPTGTVSTDMSESDSGRIKLTTPDGFRFGPFARFSQVILPLEATIYLHYITRLTGSKVLRWFFLFALMQVLSKWNDRLCKNINILFQIFAEAFCISLPDQVTLTDFDKMSEVALRLRAKQKLTDRVRNWRMSCENCIEDFTHSHCMEGKDQWKKKPTKTPHNHVNAKLKGKKGLCMCRWGGLMEGGWKDSLWGCSQSPSVHLQIMCNSIIWLILWWICEIRDCLLNLDAAERDVILYQQLWNHWKHQGCKVIRIWQHQKQAASALGGSSVACKGMTEMLRNGPRTSNPADEQGSYFRPE